MKNANIFINTKAAIFSALTYFDKFSGRVIALSCQKDILYLQMTKDRPTKKHIIDDIR